MRICVCVWGDAQANAMQRAKVDVRGIARKCVVIVAKQVVERHARRIVIDNVVLCVQTLAQQGVHHRVLEIVKELEDRQLQLVAKVIAEVNVQQRVLLPVRDYVR